MSESSSLLDQILDHYAPLHPINPETTTLSFVAKDRNEDSTRMCVRDFCARTLDYQTKTSQYKEKHHEWSQKKVLAQQELTEFLTDNKVTCLAIPNPALRLTDDDTSDIEDSVCGPFHDSTTTTTTTTTVCLEQETKKLPRVLYIRLMDRVRTSGIASINKLKVALDEWTADEICNFSKKKKKSKKQDKAWQILAQSLIDKIKFVHTHQSTSLVIGTQKERGFKENAFDLDNEEVRYLSERVQIIQKCDLKMAWYKKQLDQLKSEYHESIHAPLSSYSQNGADKMDSSSYSHEADEDVKSSEMNANNPANDTNNDKLHDTATDDVQQDARIKVCIFYIYVHMCFLYKTYSLLMQHFSYLLIRMKMRKSLIHVTSCLRQVFIKRHNPISKT